MSSAFLKGGIGNTTGNLCYVSSIVQCIRHVLKRYLDDGAKSDIALAILNGDAMRLMRVVKVLDPNEQCDAHEFLCLLLNECSDLRRALSGIEKRLTLCRSCYSKSEPSVVPTNVICLQLCGGGNAVSIQRMLNAHFSAHIVSSYACEACDVTSEAMRTGHLTECPDILGICIVRYTMGRSGPEKNNQPIDFPLIGLVMPHTTTLYNLASVCNHGGSVRGGHYTCDALVNDQWLRFDDSVVTAHPGAIPTSSSEAYLLFFTRQE